MSKTGRDFSGLALLPAVIAVSVSIVASTILWGCGEKEKTFAPAVTDIELTPTMFTRDVSTLISDSGYTRYHITAPVWYMFENAKVPTWKFPEGLYLEKYDDDMKTDATIVCDSATYFSQSKLWRLDGNVRMKNTAGDRFLTRQLFWDQQREKVYSDSFIHIEKSNRIIEGYGFVSNQQMTSYTVRRPSGIFPVPERKNRAAVDSINQNQ